MKFSCTWKSAITTNNPSILSLWVLINSQLKWSSSSPPHDKKQPQAGGSPYRDANKPKFLTMTKWSTWVSSPTVSLLQFLGNQAAPRLLFHSCSSLPDLSEMSRATSQVICDIILPYLFSEPVLFMRHCMSSRWLQVFTAALRWGNIFLYALL